MKPTIYKYGFIAFGRKIFESFFILAYFLDFIMNKQKKAQPASKLQAVPSIILPFCGIYTQECRRS